MRIRSVCSAALLWSAAILASGCKGTEPPVATTIAVTPSTPVTLNSINQTTQLAASVLDQHGAAMTGQIVTWSSSALAIASVSSTGLVTAKANGSATVTATTGGAHTDIAVTVSQTPANATTAGDGQTAVTGSALVTPLAVHVTDVGGSPIASVTVNFAVTSGGGSIAPASSVTNASGDATATWTMGSSAGAQSATATVSPLTPITFSATAVAAGVATSAMIAGGNGQVGTQGQALAQQISVQALNAVNGPAAGVSVTFAVQAGGGTVSPTSTTTNAGGMASATWTTGSASTIQRASATVASLSPLIFSGNGIGPTQAGFQVTVANIGPSFSTAVQAAFDSATAFWQRAITADLADISSFSVAAGQCNAPNGVGSVNVDDLLILANFDAIDGPGSVLGQAGPCFIRTTGRLTIAGTMKFDTADVASLIANGSLDRVIRHEMGHVLGFGTLWSQTQFNCLQNASSAGNPLDTYFNCASGLAAFTVIGGGSYTGGNKVPVENCGPTSPTGCGAGTFNSHWREPTFGNELMTGYLNAGANPASRLTIGAMEDLGYVVDYNASEAYVHTFTVPPASFQLIPVLIDLSGDVLRMPIRVMDRNGRVVQVINP